MKILSRGDKVKNLRKYLGITQRKLALINISDCGCISRETISHIVSTSDLTYRNAKILADNFNYIAKKKKIFIRKITYQYLLENEEAQFNKLIDINLKRMMRYYKIHYSTRVEKRIIGLKKFFSSEKIPLEKKYMFNKMLINLYIKTANFPECKILTIKTLEIAIKLNNKMYILESLYNLNVIYIFLKNYNESLILKDYINEMYSLIKPEYTRCLKAIYYNSVLALVKLNKLDEASKELNRIKPLFNWSDYDNNITLLYGYINLKQNNYEAAYSIYQTMLKKLPEKADNILKMQVYYGLSETNFKCNKIDKANYYMKLILNIYNSMSNNFYNYDMLISIIELYYDLSYAQANSFDKNTHAHSLLQM